MGLVLAVDEPRGRSEQQIGRQIGGTQGLEREAYANVADGEEVAVSFPCCHELRRHSSEQGQGGQAFGHGVVEGGRGTEADAGEGLHQGSETDGTWVLEGNRTLRGAASTVAHVQGQGTQAQEHGGV